MKQRADGKFDKWKDKEFEEFWGQKQKLYWESYAGEATQVKLETLVEQDVVRKGDVWTYARAFVVGGDKGSYAQAFFIGEKGDKSNVLVEKEVKVCMSACAWIYLTSLGCRYCWKYLDFCRSSWPARHFPSSC